MESCEVNLRNSNNEKKDTENTIDSLQAEIRRLEESIAAHTKTVEEKTAEISALDKAMVEATENRAAEKSAFDEFIALNTSAIQLIKKAINQLNKFYNPHMFKAPEERELTEEERILQGAGQDIGETTAKTTIAGTTQTTTLVFAQIRAHNQDADAGMPPPPPETYGEHKHKTGKSNSVIKLMDMLINDLQTEINTGEHDE